MRRVLSATAASALFTDADAPTPLANLYHEPVAVLAMVRTAGARSDGALAHRPPRTATTTRHTEERCARSSFRAPHGRVAAVRTRRSARAAVLKKNEETTSSLAPSSTAAVVLRSSLCSRCARGSSRRSSTSGTRHRRRWSMRPTLARCRHRLRPRCPRARARPSGTQTPTLRLR